MLYWNNNEFKSMGVVVEHTPNFSKPKKKITQYIIPGRNGFLSVDEGTYEPFALSVECHAKENADYDNICKWLDGYGVLSFDGNREYTALINNSISFEKVSMFKKFIVQFLVNPIGEDKAYTTYTVQNSDSVLEINNTYTDIEPVITIIGSGDIGVTINNQSFYLDDADGEYILDCKNKVITHNGNNASGIMSGNFITLKNGNNEINYTGTITSFEIAYKRMYLWGGL